MLRTSVRTWLTGCVVLGALLATLWAYESITNTNDELQYLGSVIATWLALIGWLAAGAVVGVASAASRRWPTVEPITHALVGTALAIGVLLWAYAMLAV